MSKAHKWGKQPCCLKLKDKEKFEKKSHKLHDTIKTSGMQRERNRYETFMETFSCNCGGIEFNSKGNI